MTLPTAAEKMQPGRDGEVWGEVEAPTKDGKTEAQPRRARMVRKEEVPTKAGMFLLQINV
jgi:hypothetical protein